MDDKLVIVQVYKSKRGDFVIFKNRQPVGRYSTKDLAIARAHVLVKDSVNANPEAQVFLDIFTQFASAV